MMYTGWALFYYSLQWLRREHIERFNIETLYKHMAVDMGLKKKLPKRIREWAGVVFAFGHLCLFLAGLPAVHFNYWIHTVVICFVILWSFWNGATFYMTYFWRVYEEQITAFERQMAQAEKEMQQEAERVRSDEGCQPNGHCVMHGEEDEGDTED